MHSWTSADDVPIEVWEGSTNRTFEGEFDVNEYFPLWPEIQPEPGYCAGLHLHGRRRRHAPLIYLRDRDQPPYTSFPDYVARKAGPSFDYPAFFNTFRQRGGPIDWPWHMEVADTRHGFLQFLLITTMGGQFYLWGDANYDDLTMVCDTRGLLGIAEGASEFVREDPGFIQALNEACIFDLHPVIAFNEEQVMMTALFFTKWGGLLLGTFVVEREYPHTGISSQWMSLVHYDCGIDLSAVGEEGSELQQDS
jgi:hypothetical protein